MDLQDKASGLLEEAEKTNRSARSRTFAVVLYPDEDERHKKFLSYVTHQPRFSVCYIFHDSDDETSKRHCHCLISVRNQMKLSQFIKFFDCWISYAIQVQDRDSYLSYMLHDTPHSIEAGKRPYSINDFQGDEKLWRNLRQNSNFVQFGEVMLYYKRGDTMLTFLERMQNESLPSDFERLFDFIKANSFFVVSIFNQEINKLKYERSVNEDCYSKVSSRGSIEDLLK